MVVVKRISVLSVGKFTCILFPLFIYTFATLSRIFYSGAGGQWNLVPVIGTGLISLAFLSAYAIAGFIAGLILAALYNFLASVFGGIEIEIEKTG